MSAFLHEQLVLLREPDNCLQYRPERVMIKTSEIVSI